MGKAKLFWGIAGVACIALAVATNLTDPKPPRDECALTETQIRQLWNGSLLNSRDEAERLRITQSLIHAAESICRDAAEAKPAPLPAELQDLARR